MVYDHENLQLQLLDVLMFDDTSCIMHARGRSFCALSLRMEGDTDITYGRNRMHMSSRDLAFFPANLDYTRYIKRDKLIVFHFTVQNYVWYDIQVLHDFRYDTILPMFEKALQLWREKLPGYRYAVQAILYQIFAEIRSGLQAHREYSPMITAALSAMAERLEDPNMTIAELAAEAHVCETWFRRQFKGEMGVSPKQYLFDLRMDRAQALLNAGHDTVALVAEKTGFRDAKNFATAFKKRFGYPPSKQQYLP